MQEALPYAGLLVQAVLFAYFMGKLTSRVKSLEDHKEENKETTKRLHLRLDEMKCVTRSECTEQARNFETRLESYQQKLCSMMEELKKNQTEMIRNVAVISEKLKDR